MKKEKEKLNEVIKKRDEEMKKRDEETTRNKNFTAAVKEEKNSR
jgi:hypothetical protein